MYMKQKLTGIKMNKVDKLLERLTKNKRRDK